MAFSLKLMLPVLIQMLLVNDAFCQVAKRHKMSVHQTAIIQCEQLLSRVSNSSSEFPIYNNDPLSLFTVTVITQENLGEFFGANKLSLTDLRFNVSEPDTTTLFLQHLAAYPTLINVNASGGNIPNNGIDQRELHQNSYPSNCTQTGHRTLCKVVSVLQLRAPMILVIVTFTKSFHPPSQPEITSTLVFYYHQDKHPRNAFQFHHTPQTDRNFWVARVGFYKRNSFMNVCLPMYRVEGKNNWVYNTAQPSIEIDDEDVARKSGVGVLLEALIIVMLIVIIIQFISVLVKFIGKRTRRREQHQYFPSTRNFEVGNTIHMETFF